ncbi:hypothetical protein [Nitrosomonas ureae]|uniref:Uncharacterized protein n=1 Tax=Nitrosomonas ureae TaxID=44577 RepID=A0A2T5I618_9PROT|nr:hypothetical protein [Nitrosomonas ureae]PTQ79286.1 hypothetical protein C8R28_105318 [Nitrosomonas ureae]
MNSLNDNNLNKNIEGTISEQQNESLLVINIQLNDGTWVEERFYNQVLQLIRDIEPALELEEVYTTKFLCGKTFWDSLEKGERINAGKCVAQMIACKALPLCFAGTSKSNSRLYQLK